MLKQNKIGSIILLLSLLVLFSSAADAQMNRESPSFAERIPRMTDSFLAGQQQHSATSAASSTNALNTYSLRYPVPPDIMISADPQNTTCRQVSFVVTLIPNSGQASPSGNQAVRVRVIDKVFGNSQPVADVVLFVPGSGGSTAATIGYPLPQDAFEGPGWSNEVVVIADPENEISESNESNNSLTIAGTCS